jgi:hypothetical protein
MIEMLTVGGLAATGPFPGKPTLYWRTRCLRCGTVADYRLEYVIDKNAGAEKTCRVCYWIEWAVRADQMAQRVSDVVPDDDIRAFADENDYDLVTLVLPATRVNQPVVLRCRHCDKLKVSRVLDIHWGCECSRAQRRAEAKAARQAKKRARSGYVEPPPITGVAKPLAAAGLPAVSWWDHDRNPEALFQSVFPSAKKVVSWVGPSCGHRFNQTVASMALNAVCPTCGVSA